MNRILILLITVLAIVGPTRNAAGQTGQQLLFVLLGNSCEASDADAANYITRLTAAGAVLTCEVKTGINTYVTGLKSAGLWTKIIEQGPMIGGTAATHAINLKGFSTTLFPNGATHSATGTDWNGSNQYGNTGVKPSNASQNSMHIAYYSGELSTGGTDASSIQIGARTSTSRNKITAETVSGGVQITGSINSGNLSIPAVPGSVQGLFVVSRTVSTGFNGFYNGTLAGTATIASVAQSGSNIYIGAGASGATPELYSTRECRFWSVGYGLTDSEAITMSTLINNLQKVLGRNTYN